MDKRRFWVGVGLVAVGSTVACRSNSSQDGESSSRAVSRTEADAAAEPSAAEGESQTADQKDASVQGELVYVTKIQAPFAVLEGEALPVTLMGNLPTPA